MSDKEKAQQQQPIEEEWDGGIGEVVRDKAQVTVRNTVSPPPPQSPPPSTDDQESG